jgi:thiol-disulfide isomerase/thioredoxin
MVEFSTYNETFEFWNSNNSKIKCVIFYKQDCPYCDDFIPHVLEPALEAKANNFDVRKICVDTSGLPFPPLNTPVVYFSVPNTSESMPLIRSGSTTLEVLNDDLDCMIAMKNEGKTIQQAFFDNRAPVLSAWTQFFTKVVR